MTEVELAAAVNAMSPTEQKVSLTMLFDDGIASARFSREQLSNSSTAAIFLKMFDFGFSANAQNALTSCIRLCGVSFFEALISVAESRPGSHKLRRGSIDDERRACHMCIRHSEMNVRSLVADRSREDRRILFDRACLAALRPSLRCLWLFCRFGPGSSLTVDVLRGLHATLA